MIDHMGMGVRDYAAAKRFYEEVLQPLGYAVMMESDQQHAADGSSSEGVAACGFGKPGGAPDFWIADEAPATKLHVAFRADSREQVDAFHAAALAAGARDNGAPGLRPHYHPNYYGAFVIDPDGNNIEAVHHGPAGAVAQESY